MLREFLNREKLFQGLANDTTFINSLTKIIVLTIVFLGIYGAIYGYWLNEQNLEWILKDLIKFPATFLLTILFSLPGTYLVAIVSGTKKGAIHTFAVSLSGTAIMSTFTLAFGGILVILMGMNGVSYDFLQMTHGLIILFSALIGNFYVFFGFKNLLGLNDSAAMVLVFIGGIIWFVMLPQAAGLIGPYSSGAYASPFFEGISGMWGSAQMTSALR